MFNYSLKVILALVVASCLHQSCETRHKHLSDILGVKWRRWSRSVSWSVISSSACYLNTAFMLISGADFAVHHRSNYICWKGARTSGCELRVRMCRAFTTLKTVRQTEISWHYSNLRYNHNQILSGSNYYLPWPDICSLQFFLPA